MNAVPNKQDIFALEKKYRDAIKNNDVDTAVALTKFPCTVAGPKGAQRVSKDQYRQMMQSNKSDQYKGVELKDAHVDILNENTALISYSTVIKGMKMLDVSTWVREEDKWVCAFHSENPLQ